MAGRGRSAGIVAAGVLALAGALPVAAQAQVRAPAFTDYGRSTADQYGSPGGDSSGVAGASSSGGAAGKPDTSSSATNPSHDVGGRAHGRSGGAGQERGSALPLRDATGGGLPFTGFDLTLVALLGIVLLALGAALRLAVRTRAAAARRPV
jgi:hypothetical protein